jgi:hypothetical protein
MAPLPKKASLSKKNEVQAQAEEEACASGATSLQQGIYTVWTAGKKPDASTEGVFAPMKRPMGIVGELRQMLPYGIRLVRDIFALGPCISATMWTLDIIQSVAPGIQMYISSRLLAAVSPIQSIEDFVEFITLNRSKRG